MQSILRIGTKGFYTASRAKNVNKIKMLNF